MYSVVPGCTADVSKSYGPVVASVVPASALHVSMSSLDMTCVTVCPSVKSKRTVSPCITVTLAGIGAPSVHGIVVVVLPPMEPPPLIIWDGAIDGTCEPRNDVVGVLDGAIVVGEVLPPIVVGVDVGPMDVVVVVVACVGAAADTARHASVKAASVTWLRRGIFRSFPSGLVEVCVVSLRGAGRVVEHHEQAWEAVADESDHNVGWRECRVGASSAAFGGAGLSDSDSGWPGSAPRVLQSHQPSSSRVRHFTWTTPGTPQRDSKWRGHRQCRGRTGARVGLPLGMR